jgi:hypothetical protein
MESPRRRRHATDQRAGSQHRSQRLALALP